jgi:hypothetical protein
MIKFNGKATQDLCALSVLDIYYTNFLVKVLEVPKSSDIEICGRS